MSTFFPWTGVTRAGVSSNGGSASAPGGGVFADLAGAGQVGEGGGPTPTPAADADAEDGDEDEGGENVNFLGSLIGGLLGGDTGGD